MPENQAFQRFFQVSQITKGRRRMIQRMHIAETMESLRDWPWWTVSNVLAEYDRRLTSGQDEE
jgi:hypothetical protein